MPIERRRTKSIYNKAKRHIGLTVRERMYIRNILLPATVAVAMVHLIESEDDEEEGDDGELEEEGEEEDGNTLTEDVLNTLLAQYTSISYANVPVSLPMLPRATIDNFNDHDCYLYFRFTKQHLYDLLDVLDMPEHIRLINRSVVGRELALLSTLHRLGQGTGHFLKASRLFGIEESKLVRTFHYCINYIVDHFAYLMTDNLDYWQPLFPHFAECIKTKFEAATELNLGDAEFSVMGFIDGNDTRSSRPGGGPMEGGINAPRYNQEIQRAFFNKYRHFHGIKQLTFTGPNGMTLWHHGVKSRRRNDNFLVMESDINRKLLEVQEGQPHIYKMYGDDIFHQVECLIGGRRGLLNPREALEKRGMKALRISIEWSYGEMVSQFPFVANSRNIKLLSRTLDAKHYVVVALLLRNAKVCLEGCNAAKYFNCTPPSLQNYFVKRN